MKFSPQDTTTIEKLEKGLSIKIEKKEIFIKALTHKTFAFEKGDIGSSNELLEFLGDSVLNFYISKKLFELFPKANEGALTRMRSSLVNTRRLSKIAKNLNLHKFLKVGSSFEGDVTLRPTVLADTLEAIIGAIFVDSGLKGVSQFIEKNFEIEKAEDSIDAKSKLQQITQKKYGILPEYRVVKEEGVPHKKTFTVEVFVNGKLAGSGTGPNKKAAENSAAEQALKKYEKG